MFHRGWVHGHIPCHPRRQQQGFRVPTTRRPYTLIPRSPKPDNLWWTPAPEPKFRKKTGVLNSEVLDRKPCHPTSPKGPLILNPKTLNPSEFPPKEPAPKGAKMRPGPLWTNHAQIGVEWSAPAGRGLLIHKGWGIKGFCKAHKGFCEGSIRFHKGLYRLIMALYWFWSC